MTYRYLFADALTRQIIEELPLEGARFGSRLKGAGPFNAMFRLGDKRTQKLDWTNATLPGKTIVYVDLDGRLVWGGILWTRHYRSDTRTLDLGGLELESFFTTRFITTTLRFSDEVDDQLDIARALIDHVQTQPNSNIGIQLGTELSGRKRTRTYHHYELKRVLEALTQLSNVIDGFDYAIDVQYNSNGDPEQILRLDYSHRGRLVGETGLMFEYPGNITLHEWPEDATWLATKMWAIGAGEGDDMLLATRTNQLLLSAGYPLLEDSYSYKDIVLSHTLNEHAQADLEMRGRPAGPPRVKVRRFADPAFGSYITGDHCRVRITDERFPETLDDYYRILGWDIVAEQDEVQIYLGRSS